jgi:hypothetical protein
LGIWERSGACVEVYDGSSAKERSASLSLFGGEIRSFLLSLACSARISRLPPSSSSSLLSQHIPSSFYHEELVDSEEI